MEQENRRKEIILAFILFAPIFVLIIVLSIPKPCNSGHTWSVPDEEKNNCERTRICSVCGKEERETLHDWIGATCQKPGICSRCGEEGYKKSHEYAFGRCKFCSEDESFYTFTSDDDDDDFWFAVTSAQNRSC